MKGGNVIIPSLDGTGPQGQSLRTGRGQGWGTKKGQSLGNSVERSCPNCGNELTY